MRSRDTAAKAHHYCGLLVVFGVMVWLAVEIALKVAGEVTW